MTRYKLTVWGISDWCDSEYHSQGLIINGKIDSILKRLAKQKRKPKEWNMISKGKGWVLPFPTTEIEALKYRSIESDRELLCKIGIYKYELEKLETDYLKVLGREESKKMKKIIEIKAIEIKSLFDELSNVAKNAFAGEITPSLKALPQQNETKQETPKTFEELFYDPHQVEPCLEILRQLQKPVIDGNNTYIGNAKGVFPLWIKVLKSHKPEPIIKHFSDKIYKDLLNKKINGLNLTQDASEFRKTYSRLKKENVELDIKAILSQYSQNGKLGK